MATWNDNDSSDDDDSKEDEIGTLCFMALDELNVKVLGRCILTKRWSRKC